MHNTKVIILPLLAGLMMMAACDSGDIVAPAYTVSQTGRAVRLRATASGVSALDDDLCVALAAFAPGSTYATVQRTISSATPDGTAVELVLGNLADDVATAELVLSGKLRNRMLTLAEADLTAVRPGDTLEMDLGPLEMNLTGCVQRGVFDQTCVQCHGNAHQAAGLNLSPGHSLEQLAGVASVCVPGSMRVAPGQSEASVLHQVLAPDGSHTVGFNHLDLLGSQFRSNLQEARSIIDRWITSMAAD